MKTENGEYVQKIGGPTYCKSEICTDNRVVNFDSNLLDK